MARPPRRIPAVIRNKIAQHAEFTAVRSADAPGYVDVLIDRGRGRFELVQCLRDDALKTDEAARDALQLVRCGYLLALRDARTRKLPRGLVCSGSDWVAVRRPGGVFIENRATPPKVIGRLPHVAEEVEIMNALELINAGIIIGREKAMV